MTNLKQLPAQSTWLKAAVTGPRVGVDRPNKVILGYVVAQEGPFREDDPRGEFDEKALKQIVKLMKAKRAGLKSRFAHPSLSGDGLGTFLGRSQNPRMDSVHVERGGQQVELKAVRADLHLSPTAFEANPNGNLGEYILTLAESDPDAFSSSLVLQRLEEYRLNKDGTRQLDDAGRPLPPLWRPTALHASDIVDEGAAVDGFLSADAPDAVVRQGAALLDRHFGGQSRETIQSRCQTWLTTYLDLRFGSQVAPDPAGTAVNAGGGPAALELADPPATYPDCPEDGTPCTQDCPIVDGAQQCQRQEQEQMQAQDEILLAEIDSRCRDAVA